MSKKLQKLYKKHFNYNSKTGVMTWKEPMSKRISVGDLVGTINDKGYRCVTFKKQSLKVHRIAYIMHYGIEPNIIDHDNRVKDDNRISNLTNTTTSGNLRNAKKSSNNTSGVTGVRKNTKGDRWVASIYDNGKNRHLGVYVDIDDAIKARKKAEKVLGYHKNHGVG